MKRYAVATLVIVAIWIGFTVMGSIFSWDAALFRYRMNVVHAWFIVGSIVASVLTILITRSIYRNAPAARKADERRQLANLLNNLDEEEVLSLRQNLHPQHQYDTLEALLEDQQEKRKGY